MRKLWRRLGGASDRLDFNKDHEDSDDDEEDKSGGEVESDGNSE